MKPLGFRFDNDAVVIAGVAHRPDCAFVVEERLCGPDVLALQAGAVMRSQRCPAACPSCRPAFETLLSYQLPQDPLPVG